MKGRAFVQLMRDVGFQPHPVPHGTLAAVTIATGLILDQFYFAVRLILDSRPSGDKPHVFSL